MRRWLLLALLLGGCYRQELRERAATDFQCSRHQIVTTQVDEETTNASGCGHQANYRWNGKQWEPAAQPAASQ